MTPAQPTVADLFIACLQAGGNLVIANWQAWQFSGQYKLQGAGRVRSYTCEREFTAACAAVAPLSMWRIWSYTPRGEQVKAHAALRATCPRLFQQQEVTA